jgi:Arc/MetJ-type ribon-helix-helix transcriptional regulator
LLKDRSEALRQASKASLEKIGLESALRTAQRKAERTGAQANINAADIAKLAAQAAISVKAEKNALYEQAKQALIRK